MILHSNKGVIAIFYKKETGVRLWLIAIKEK